MVEEGVVSQLADVDRIVTRRPRGVNSIRRRRNGVVDLEGVTGGDDEAAGAGGGREEAAVVDGAVRGGDHVLRGGE